MLQMKFLRRLKGRGFFGFAQVLLTAILLTGCATTPNPGPGSAEFGDVPPPSEAAAQPQNGGSTRADVFRVGDLVTVKFSGLINPIPDHEERIKEDGFITLPLVGAVKALDHTPGEIQKEIYALYVPKYYPADSGFTLTVMSTERVYYVGGEVRKPGPQFYLGDTTLTMAIQAAGGFTDFGKQTKVHLTHANGVSVIVNYKKAIRDPSLDRKVFPGDRIDVPKRWF
jgi:protein involved in polysaccharide export with SLBB domain